MESLRPTARSAKMSETRPTKPVYLDRVRVRLRARVRVRGRVRVRR